MPDYGFTKREISTYFTDSQTDSTFGRIFIYNTDDVSFEPPYLGLKDYIELFIYDINDNFLQKKTLKLPKLTDEDIDFNLNIGQHLRDCGYIQGDYKVLYKFLRKVAGDDSQFIVVDSNGQVYNGSYQTGPSEEWDKSTDPPTPRYFKVIDDVVDLTKEVFIHPFTYRIDEASPDGTEVKLSTNPSIDNATYVDNLQNVNGKVIYFPGQKIKFGQEGDNKKITETNVLSLMYEPSGYSLGNASDLTFTKGMEGDEIILQNFFEALIPTHGVPLDPQTSRGSKDGNKFDVQLDKSPLTKALFDGTITSARLLGTFPKPFAVFNPLETELSPGNTETMISLTNYYKRTASDTGRNTKFERDSVAKIKERWLCLGINNRSEHRHGTLKTGKKHTHWKGDYPRYVYDRTTDTCNIDWDMQQPGVALDGKILGDKRGYHLNQNMMKVYIDLRLKIKKVNNERQIIVESKMKDQYHYLKENGFWVVTMGGQDINNYSDINFNNLISDKPLIETQINDVSDYKTYLKYKDDEYLITNSRNQLGELYLKLKQPLSQRILSMINDSDFNPRDDDTTDIVEDDVYGFSIVERRLPNLREKISLVPSVKVNNTFLYTADLDNIKEGVLPKETEFKTHTTLKGTDLEVTNKIEKSLLSGSLLDVQPNVDYQKTTTDLLTEVDDTGFGNFVNFSNAERRLTNFKTKLQLIESHTAASSSLIGVTSATTQIRSLENKRQRVINSFDPYEHYLYFESSSYVSSSNGLFHDTSWPKANSTEPYKLVHTSHSTATTWYDNMILSASSYDFNNPNSLRNSLPEHIYADTQNNVFLEFMDMVGQQFDEVWIYTRHLTDVNKRINNLSEGISKDVARQYAQALGLELNNGNDLLDLPAYLLGKNSDGTDLYESPQEEITEEIWKRVLANLPFFIKTKGTERSLKGLLNCYGIPSSILRVREYGGPDKGTRVSYEIKRRFTHALDFKGSQFIKTAWNKFNTINNTWNAFPNTVEFRFRTPYSVGSSGSMQILTATGSVSGAWGISLQDNGTTDNYGHLRFALSASDGTARFITSSLLPFYNDDMWSVMLTRKSSSGQEHYLENTQFTSSYELTTKQYDSTRQRIIYQDSQSMVVTSSKFNSAYSSSKHVFLGGSGSRFGTQFTGSLMEYRLWAEALSSSVFDNHVRTPKAYNGNYFSSSYDNLLVRYELNENKNLQSFPTASSTAHIKQYETSSVQVNGFTGNFYRSLTDQEKIRVPNLGTTRRNATKIRIEDNKLLGDLDVDVTQEVSSQDFAPIDSNKLGIYLSPTDVINEDIIYSLADIDFDDYIGDPRDEFEYSYRTLDIKKKEYFKRYSGANNFFDYLRILTYYDKSIFRTLKQFIPARAKELFGNLIEPNLLERTKEVIGKKPSTRQPYFENAEQFDAGIQVSRITTSGSHDNLIRPFGSYESLSSVIGISSGSRGNQISTLVNINQLDRRSSEPATYATASVTFGGEGLTFGESVQPTILNGRLSVRNQEQKFFYTSSLSDSIAKGFGEHTKWGNEHRGFVYKYSSSFDATDLERATQNTILDKVYYEGTKLTEDNTRDGLPPVQITLTSPTTMEATPNKEVKLTTK